MWTTKLGDAEHVDRGYGKVSENAGESERLAREREHGQRGSFLVFSYNGRFPKDVHEETILRRWVKDIMSDIAPVKTEGIPVYDLLANNIKHPPHTHIQFV